MQTADAEGLYSKGRKRIHLVEELADATLRLAATLGGSPSGGKSSTLGHHSHEGT